MTNKQTSIFDTLSKLGLTSKESRFIFNNRTRDVDNLNVWKDSKWSHLY